MSSVAQKWRQLLEEQYDVQPEAAAHLVPVLERIAVQEPSPEEWEGLLRGVAAACRATRSSPHHRKAGREIRMLVDDFVAEVRKMDESLKVMSVYLERLQQRMKLPTPPLVRLLN